MDFKLLSAGHGYKEVLSNLLQFYMYDFSEYTDCDVEANGLFGAYPGLDYYWEEADHKFPYLLQKDGTPIGFVLVRFIQTAACDYFSIAEFFIMKKYRRAGIGKAAAKQVFDLHRGQWEVHQKKNNLPARAFWRTVIDEYTQGLFTERLENKKAIQDFENQPGLHHSKK